MALLHCNFFSTVLELSCSMDLILPEPKRSPKGALLEEKRNYPVLYLLHGLSDDHTIWQRRTSIERYANELDLAVVMPAVDRSFYADMRHGNCYWTFISEEVPQFVRSLFPISAARKDNFVAGLSMGGYGAMKLALTYPERYAAAASLSGALDIRNLFRGHGKEWRHEMRNIFGDPKNVPGSELDLFALAERLAESKWKQIPLFVWCGTEDFLIAANRGFKAHAEELGLNLAYDEGPGDHSWVYWDQTIQRVLEWLPIKQPKKSK